MSRTYSTAELAQEFGVTARTIRHYEGEGLLMPQREGTTRIFGGRDRARLKLALRGKRVGIALQEIRELFHLYDEGQKEPRHLQQFLAKLEKRRALLEEQRNDIDAMLTEIDFFAECCRRGNARGSRG